MENKLIEKYADNPYVRALITAIPYVGGAIDVVLSEKGSEWRKERIELLLKNLNERVGKLKLDIEEINNRFKTEEFYDSIIHALESSTKTRHHSKINGYANILINEIVVPDDQKLYSIDLILSTLDIITIDEIKYLSFLFQNNNEIQVHKVFGVFIYLEKYKNEVERSGRKADNRNELTKDCLFELNLDIIWKFLSDKNIITIDDNPKAGDVRYSSGNFNMMTNGYIEYSSSRIYRLTEYGNYFVKWIIDNE